MSEDEKAVKSSVKFLKLIWVPCLWASLVGLHMVLFSTEPQQNNVFLLLFDKLILFSCFIVYPVKFFGQGSFVMVVFAFAGQFLFWWAFSYFATYLVRRLKANESPE